VRVPPPLAITRAISPAIASCELTHLERVPIDIELAQAQHREYEQALADAGYLVEHLDAAADVPDSVFVEDIAVVFDELAILTRPGAASRRAETAAVAAALARHRRCETINEPATIDGGDVLVAGRRVFVGRSSRTNDAAILQLTRLLQPFNYSVTGVTVHGCLHLKSAITALSDTLLLINPEWIDREAFAGFEFVDVDAESMAANALRLRDRIIFPSAFPRTAERLRQRGLKLQMVDASELAKAEGAVTCCSLIVESGGESVVGNR
jgi:dimethylargininase